MRQAISAYDLSALPVVDENRRLLGVIRGDDLVDVIEKEATEDMYRIAGVVGEAVHGPLASSVRRRLPWLVLNLGTVFLAAAAVGLFEPTLVKVVALAAFIPVIPGQAGMGGVQSMTLIVRAISLGQASGRTDLRLVWRELLLALSHGLVLGMLVGLIGYVWRGSYVLSLILAGAMLGSMSVAGLTGVGVPLLLRRAGVDPAVSSAVFVTTITDVIGIVLFLGLASVFVDLL